MTGLIYNKPEDPISFLESAIGRLRINPNLALKWDSFVEFCPNSTSFILKAVNDTNDNQASDSSTASKELENEKANAKKSKFFLT